MWKKCNVQWTKRIGEIPISFLFFYFFTSMHDNRWEAEKEEEKGKKEEQEKEKTMEEDKPKAPLEKVSFSCFQKFVVSLIHSCKM